MMSSSIRSLFWQLRIPRDHARIKSYSKKCILINSTFMLVPKTLFISDMKSHIWHGSFFFINELGAIDITWKTRFTCINIFRLCLPTDRKSLFCSGDLAAFLPDKSAHFVAIGDFVGVQGLPETQVLLNCLWDKTAVWKINWWTSTLFVTQQASKVVRYAEITTSLECIYPFDHSHSAK